MYRDFYLHDMSFAVFANTSYVSRTIKDVTGWNFNQFVNSYRVERAKDMIRKNPALSLKDIYAECGFGSDVSLINAFKIHEGITPGAYVRIVRCSVC